MSAKVGIKSCRFARFICAHMYVAIANYPAEIVFVRTDTNSYVSIMLLVEWVASSFLTR